MKESATEVLLARSVNPDRFGKMLGVSAMVHVVALLVVILLPSEWGVRAETEVGPTMSISLGGPEGPDTGGQTPLGGRPVQQASAGGDRGGLCFDPRCGGIASAVGRVRAPVHECR